MNLNNKQIGNGIQFFGWFVVLLNLVKYGYGVYDTLSDASVSAYAPLIIIEGGFYVCGGLFFVWLGRRIWKSAEKQQAAEK